MPLARRIRHWSSFAGASDSTAAQRTWLHRSLYRGCQSRGLHGACVYIVLLVSSGFVMPPLPLFPFVGFPWLPRPPRVCCVGLSPCTTDPQICYQGLRDFCRSLNHSNAALIITNAFQTFSSMDDPSKVSLRAVTAVSVLELMIHIFVSSRYDSERKEKSNGRTNLQSCVHIQLDGFERRQDYVRGYWA